MYCFPKILLKIYYLANFALYLVSHNTNPSYLSLTLNFKQQWQTQVCMFFYLSLFCFSSSISFSPKLRKTQIWNLSWHSKPLQIKQTSLQLGTPPPSLSLHSHYFLATRLAGKQRERSVRSDSGEWRGTAQR